MNLLLAILDCICLLHYLSDLSFAIWNLSSTIIQAEVTAEQINTIITATNNTVEGYYPVIFANFLSSPEKIAQLIASPGGGGGGGDESGGGEGAAAVEEVEEKVEEEEVEMDMSGGGGLFGEEEGEGGGSY